jgi:glycine/D-amino acid oxidase-like deaminating enzyme
MGKNVLVVGAGIIGASLAWHLVDAGCSVTVVDAGTGGGQATPASFAWINASWGNPEWYSRFRRRSMAGWRRLEMAVPGVRVDWCGGLLWDIPPAGLRAYAEEQRRWGYGIREVDRAGALAIEPNLIDPPELAVHVAEEGMLEPEETARALLAAAVSRGARFLPDVHVAALRESGGRISGVVTASGETIPADETVVAAGVDSARLLESTGFGMRLDAPAGLVAHSTRTTRRLLGGLVMTPRFHVRQTREGRLIAGSDFGGSNPAGRQLEVAEGLVAAIRQAIRGADDLALDFVTVGLRPTPHDGFPAIGRPAGLAGAYLAVLHSGVTLAPVVGELAAREIATGDRDADLAPYDPNRDALAAGA